MPGTPDAIEIPDPTFTEVVSDSTTRGGPTTHPGAILPNPEFAHGGVDETVITIPSGTATSTDQQVDKAMNADNKNPFRNLNSTVSESGSNLSQGQRQLLCLARALLKAPKVLLMDEATASIDYATDAKIQETIREIKNTTITIAHRLQTIIDYDKVLVLDKGEVMEYGDPWDLLEKKGMFYGMCESTGEIDALKKEAKKACDSRETTKADSSAPR